jgi:3-oxoacyl-[acyl-carrier-protein] synthase I
MVETVHIASLGAATPVGRGAWASAAAVRAGITGFVQHPHMIDTAGAPMRAAIAPWLDVGVVGIDRFEALLMPAIEEALAGLDAAPKIAAERFAFALALPSPRPGLRADLAAELMGRAQQRFKGRFGAFAAFPAGHAAGLLGLRAAAARLARGTLDACLLAGVDTWIEPETLEWLEANDQLHSAGPLNNAWGFIPGEAGAAVLLVRQGVLAEAGVKPLATVVGVGQAHEPKRIKTQTVCIGEGLTEALRAALAPLPAGSRVSDTYCDMNGEPYRADEFGFAALRTKAYFESASDFTAPADCWGDVSAAGSLLHLMLAVAAAHKGYAKGPLALVWGSGETGERGAAVLATPDWQAGHGG